MDMFNSNTFLLSCGDIRQRYRCDCVVKIPEFVVEVNGEAIMGDTSVCLAQLV